MKPRFTQFLFPAALAISVFALAAPALASSTEKTITATFKNIRVFVDGTIANLKDAAGATVEPFIYNGSVYLPARAVSDALGKTVTWDDTTNSVFINSPPLPTYAPPEQTPTPEPSFRMDGNDIIRRIDFKVGSQPLPIDLPEIPSTGVKWQILSTEYRIDNKGITFTNDEYVNADPAADAVTHRFNFTAQRDFPIGPDDFIFTITFGQFINGREIGGKTICNCYIAAEPVDLKPVIYLYPKNPTDVTVALNYHGILDYSYPSYDSTIGGWSVKAYPDGTIINHADNQEYSYLFWEGHGDWSYDFSNGFVVKGSDTASFLRDKLSLIGLTPREYNEFIVYWLPKLLNNPYNLISFQQEAYTDNAALTITPAPDSMLRVFMAVKPITSPVNIKPQTLTPFDRHGFTVVEWGGALVQ